MKLQRITPEFVDHIPQELDPGKLYVCCRYRAVKHLCACGCGVAINTPLHPTAWILTCDGVSVSLCPSVGNWAERCQSHYCIVNNKIQWGTRFSRRDIVKTRRRRVWERERYFGGTSSGSTTDIEVQPVSFGMVIRRRLRGTWRWISGR